VAEAGSIWFCYMLRCNDDFFYVGIAIDVEDRVKRHNWGVGPRYTAIRRPVELVWSECCGDVTMARSREKEIKGWSRKKKLQLVNGERGNPSPQMRAQGKGESSNG
jgi:predicted GIY-YIG superfamily endonuclease